MCTAGRSRAKSKNPGDGGGTGAVIALSTLTCSTSERFLGRNCHAALHLHPPFPTHAHSPYALCHFLHSLPNFVMMLYVSFQTQFFPVCSHRCFCKIRDDPKKLQSLKRLLSPKTEANNCSFPLLMRYIHSCAAPYGSRSDRHPFLEMLNMESVLQPLCVDCPSDGRNRAQGQRLFAKGQKASLMTSLSPRPALLSFPFLSFTPSFLSALILRSFPLLWLLDNAPQKPIVVSVSEWSRVQMREWLSVFCERVC